jgi:hypothetical protein
MEMMFDYVEDSTYETGYLEGYPVGEITSKNYTIIYILLLIVIATLKK